MEIEKTIKVIFNGETHRVESQVDYKSGGYDDLSSNEPLDRKLSKFIDWADSTTDEEISNGVKTQCYDTSLKDLIHKYGKVTLEV